MRRRVVTIPPDRYLIFYEFDPAPAEVAPPAAVAPPPPPPASDDDV